MSLFQQWLDAKAQEAEAIKQRRALEDMMVKAYSIPEGFDGTKNIEAEGFKVKIEGRLTRKVNADKLQELAAEAGLTQHLSSLFRWKPEINAAVWKATSDNITAPLLDAITTSAGRPSFTIVKE